jgi:hypothetical protein
MQGRHVSSDEGDANNYGWQVPVYTAPVQPQFQGAMLIRRGIFRSPTSRRRGRASATFSRCVT